ncbi:MAG TPA: ROK family protein [Candidatus Saccharimonadales bacterium]|nr:ROK family protein [Candidatus Saccharimonadales bacterium]
MTGNFEALEAGTCIAFGATNARVGHYEQGDIVDFQSVSTPDNPKEFFDWMATQTLEASERGSSWVVAGFPGPVSPDGKLVGPMPNVGGMSEGRYDLEASLRSADPAAGRLMEEGFRILAVNDGELSAQAAALTIGEGKFDRVADIIIGTGVGSGFVHRVPGEAVYRADPTIPAEIGHLMLDTDAEITFETTLAGPSLERRYGISPEKMEDEHPAMVEVGRGACKLSTTLGLMYGAELIAISGGVGANASDKYGPHLKRLIESYEQSGNGPQRLYLPQIIPVKPEDAQVFELFGAEGVVRDFSTRA